MNKKYLYVMAVGNKMHPNLHSVNVRRYIGWTWNGEQFVKKTEPERIPWMAEYVQAIQFGDLLEVDNDRD